MQRQPFALLSVLVLLAAALKPSTCTLEIVPTTEEATPVVAPTGAPSIAPTQPATAVDTTIAPEPEARRQIEQIASPATSTRPIQLVVLQDVTGSFAQQIGHARTALLNLVEDSASWPRGSQIGLTAFVGGVEPDPWTPMTPTTEHAEIAEQWATLSTCNCTMPTSSDQQGYQRPFCEIYYGGFDAHPHMPDCHALGAQSNPAASMEQAHHMLEGLSGRKIAILVGDIMPCCGSETEARTAALLWWARSAGREGWDVWVLATTEPPFLHQLAQNDGAALHVEPSDLPEAMDRILDTLGHPATPGPHR